MKKKWIALIVLAVLIPVAWVILRLTGIIEFWINPTNSNEPTLAEGSWIFTSILKEPHRMDMVAYNEDRAGFGKEAYIKRLVGLEGDTVEIKGNVLFVNGKNMDENLILKKIYMAPREISDKLPVKPPRNEEEKKAQRWMKTYYRDSMPVYLETIAQSGLIRRCSKAGSGTLTPDGFPYQYNWGTDSWTTHDFGPVVVPAGKWFLLGDNRDQSLDSRSLGFTDKEDFRGTLLK